MEQKPNNQAQVVLIVIFELYYNLCSTLFKHQGALQFGAIAGFRHFEIEINSKFSLQ